MFQRSVPVVLATMAWVNQCAEAQPPAAASQPAAAIDSGWPRTYTQTADPNYRVIVYQPQIDHWERSQRVSFRCALAVHRGASVEPVYGVAEVNADTLVSDALRIVRINNPEFTYRFPLVDAATAAECERFASGVLPQRQSFELSLDRMLAYIDTPQARQREVVVSLDPPPIFYSPRPATLVVFLGDPDFKPVKDTTLRYAANCNWDVLVDPATATSYLLYGESWLRTRDLHHGPWEPARRLPDVFDTLPDDDEWSDIRAKLPGAQLDVMPDVFMSREPAEIIVTEGQPTYAAIPGVRLKAVTNTESPLFRHVGDLNFYFLVAGRWFRARSLEGPWTAATNDLPADFKQIPRDSEWAYVLPSVAGTDEAADAVMLASVLRTATVNIKDIQHNVVYQGNPRFAPIGGTTLNGATNTTATVIGCNGRYYSCENAVWFVADSPNGPWTCATSVPQEIYSIPPTHPAHNVTYAQVLAATESTVDVGYSSGYDNALVTAGVLVLGAGVVAAVAAADDVNWNVRINLGGNTISSYGRGAFYDSATGFYCRGGNSYGPHAGRVGGVYDKDSGSWTRRTSGSGGFSMQVSTFGEPVGGANRFSAWSRGVSSSAGVGALAVRDRASGWRESTERGNLARRGGPDGDLYAGRDGRVYRRNGEGEWQQRDAGGWRKAEGDGRDAVGAGQRSLNADALARGRSIAADQRNRSGVGSHRGAGRGGGRRGR